MPRIIETPLSLEAKVSVHDADKMISDLRKQEGFSTLLRGEPWLSDALYYALDLVTDRILDIEESPDYQGSERVDTLALFHEVYDTLSKLRKVVMGGA